MPLKSADRKTVIDYVEHDLGSDSWFKGKFDFISNEELKHRLALEFYAASYVNKLGEALAVTGGHRHAHVKFQIVQYASIYEAIIVHYLFNEFVGTPEVNAILYHDAYKNSVNKPKSLNMTNTDGEETFLCVVKKERTNPFSVRFDDKVGAAVALGLVDQGVGEDVKRFYKLRNAIHLETAVRDDIEYELADSQLAFERLLPLLETFKAGLAARATQAAGQAAASQPPLPVTQVAVTPADPTSSGAAPGSQPPGSGSGSAG